MYIERTNYLEYVSFDANLERSDLNDPFADFQPGYASAIRFAKHVFAYYCAVR